MVISMFLLRLHVFKVFLTGLGQHLLSLNVNKM